MGASLNRLIYVESWQMECCGDPFAVNSTIHWTVAPADHDFLDVVLGEELSSTVTDAEEHHLGPADTSAHQLDGVIRSIRTVSCAYAKPEGATALYPVPESALLQEVSSSHDAPPLADGQVFLGWLVSVATQP